MNSGLSKAVVSGSTGFLGSCLALRLIKSNIPVLGVDLAPTPFMMAGYRHIQSSIEEARESIKTHLDGGGVFFHMAGLADRMQCEKRPADAFAVNVALTFSALDICEQSGNVKFLLPSTGIVYGLHLDRPAVEEDPTHPESVYTGSKLTAEILVQAHTKGRLRGSIVARLSNVYGPGSRENTVLGRLIGQVSRNEPIRVLDERPVRDFIHVDDTVEALVRLAETDFADALVVNVSTARGVKIGDVAEMVAKLSGLPHQTSGAANSGLSTKLVLNNSRLDRLTGWVPQIQLEDGLKICLKGSGAFNPGVEQKL